MYKSPAHIEGERLSLLWRAPAQRREFQRQLQLRDGVAGGLCFGDLEFVAVALGGDVESAAQLGEILLDPTQSLAR